MVHPDMVRPAYVKKNDLAISYWHTHMSSIKVLSRTWPKGGGHGRVEHCKRASACACTYACACALACVVCGESARLCVCVCV